MSDKNTSLVIDLRKATVEEREAIAKAVFHAKAILARQGQTLIFRARRKKSGKN